MSLLNCMQNAMEKKMSEETELLELIHELRAAPDFQFEPDSVKRKFDLCEDALHGDAQAFNELNILLAFD